MKYLGHILSVALLLLLPWVGAEELGDQDPQLDIDEIRKVKTQIADDASLDEDLRAQIIEVYDSAIASLEQAEEARRAAAAFEENREIIRRAAESLRERLSRPTPPVQLDDADSLTADGAHAALTRERSRLAAHRAALQEAIQRSEDRSRRLADIAGQLGKLDQQHEALSGDVRVLDREDLPDALEEAARIEVLARREATMTAIAQLRNSLVLLEDRGALIPLEVDLAQQKVIASEDKVALLEELSNQLRQRAADESLEAVLAAAKAAVAENPELEATAAETKALATGLWGEDGVVDRSEHTVKALLATRKHLADVNRIVELTRRKFEAFGHRGSITRWWPDVPDDLPDIEAITAVIDQVNQEIPEVQHQLITFEELRANLPAVNRQTLSEYRLNESAVLESPEWLNARNLLTLRRDLLDEVILEYGRYSNQLVEYRSLSTLFRDRMLAVEKFLYSHILWSRSVPRPIVPRLADMAEALTWFTTSEARREIFSGSAGEMVSLTRGNTLALVLLVGVIVFRRRFRKRLEVISERVADPSTDAFRYTLEAVVWTAALALPVPLLLYLAGGALYRGGGRGYFNSTAQALHVMSNTTLLLEGVRQLFVPHGLAEAHFGWPSKITRSLHRGLIWPEVIALPLIFVAINLALAGIRLNSPEQLQIYNNSLGRVAFVIGLIVLGVSILAQLRPEKSDSEAARQIPWSQRWAQYAFPTAFLVAYPVILLATIVPALLAAFGYYITGLLLAYQMERTLLFSLFVLVAGGLVHRWWLCRNTPDSETFADQSSALRAAAEREASTVQMSRLFRFSIIVVMAVGLSSIWSDASPLLQILKRVQLLPTVELVEVTDEDRLAALSAGVITEKRPSSDRAEPTVDQTPVDPTAPIGDPTEAQAAQPEVTEQTQLTLWGVLQAILAALITLVLVQNLPSLFELLLSRRTSLDSGVRVALATLLRYTVTIIGVTIVFRVLGVTWSKVQWLAAALTFGLGFGLQEIVANFVSGLILLIERPVRVGDMVTVGNLMGRVTRIQIRATTITLLDRSEMIVPNKEFITTMLVNWTLSDSKRRIEIPIRIAYGGDLERVKTMVTEIGANHPDVLAEPPAHTLLLEFGEDSLELELRFVVDFGKGLQVRDEVQMAIDKAFREEGIEFALPQRTIHVVSQETDDDRPPLEVPGS